jgi:uncharacterized protein with HEPN domain
VTEDQIYLEYILECINKIEVYSQGGKQDFLDNSMVQDAILGSIGHQVKKVLMCYIMGASLAPLQWGKFHFCRGVWHTPSLR